MKKGVAVNDTLQAIANEHGTPCFVYFFDQVIDRIRSLREAFGGRFEISYAVKSNPNRALLQRIQQHVNRLDISSGGELRKAVDLGWPPQRISFTGPGKRLAELQAAIEHRIGEVIVESAEEAVSLDELAGSQGVKQAILVRIAPKRLPRGFGVNMAGKPTQFGIDEEDLDDALKQIQKLPNLDLAGFHIYSGTQCLKAESVAENYEIFMDIFRRATETHNITPRMLVFGSGLGIPYHENDEPIDLEPIAQRINPQLDQLKAEARFADTQCLLELGRYLIGEAGIYLTSVLRVKESRGAHVAICDGGMNHHLGACGHLGGVIHRNYRIFKVTPSPQDTELIPHELVGPLCTSIDTLGHGVQLPLLKEGDVIGIHCSGAYGLTASPVNFISHEPPKELIVETDGSVLAV